MSDVAAYCTTLSASRHLFVQRCMLDHCREYLWAGCLRKLWRQASHLLESICKSWESSEEALLGGGSCPLVRADKVVGCLRNQDLSSSRAALRGMLGSVVMMCFTISSSASLHISADHRLFAMLAYG